FGASEQACGFVPCGFDLCQRLVEAPGRPRPIEASNRPTDSGADRRPGETKHRPGNDRVLKEFSSFHQSTTMGD
ncbi:MAG TPA: hypothetical protein VKJ07_16465, partial [Mycobacteriales bacterium]|nr:hypothetical protein [Mycobacteriales bacterium]